MYSVPRGESMKKLASIGKSMSEVLIVESTEEEGGHKNASENAGTVAHVHEQNSVRHFLETMLSHFFPRIFSLTK